MFQAPNQNAGEPSAGRTQQMSATNMADRAQSAGMTGLKIPGLDKVAGSFDSVNASLTRLMKTVETASRSGNLGKLTTQWKTLETQIKATGKTAGSTGSLAPGGGGGSSPSSGGTSSFGGPGLPSVGSVGTNVFGPGTATPKSMPNGGGGGNPGSGMPNMLGSGGIPDFAGAANSAGPVGVGIAAAGSFLDVMGAISGAGVQYAYNRIEGPTGNRNAMLTADRMLGTSSTMSGMSMADQTRLLASRTPVQGSFADVITSLQEGGKVGAYMKGSDNRNGFFESVRQMQAFTPGVGAGQISGALSSYMGNTRSQQMGVFMGGGAFTMMGQGGRYKSLAEWAEGITNFFKEQRPGADRGKPFSKEDLMAQNFPGSNVNAWFQQMGIPSDMTDYWWQYVMTKAATGSSTGGPWSTEQIQGAVKQTRGMDISAERLRNTTQSTRREFTMGSGMRGLYGVKESADRRFNTVMNAADDQLQNLFKTTNVGAMMSMLPTPISELLMPVLQKYASSPTGGIAAGIGGLFGDPIGDPVGDYGSLGGTGTGHLNPDLASKIQRMQRANPNIRITSGYRDTVTQNRLHRQGVGRVGPASKSAHTRGWAADLGPTSQLGWIQANAGKFGLQTATNAGEPWHVQSAGTMSERIGDPGTAPVGDIWDMLKGAGSSVFQAGMSSIPGFGQAFSMINAVKTGLPEFQKMISGFASDGGLSNMIDQAINLYMQMMLMPLTGQAKLFGTNNFGTDTGGMNDIINKQATVAAIIPGFTGFSGVPSITSSGAAAGAAAGGGASAGGGAAGGGFGSAVNLITGIASGASAGGSFGAAVRPAGGAFGSGVTMGDPIGDYGRMTGTSPNLNVSPITITNHITVTGAVAGDSDAKKVATSIGRHLDAQMTAAAVRSR